eukprot:2464911-Pyramimonas_sp.AAC.2
MIHVAGLLLGLEDPTQIAAGRTTGATTTASSSNCTAAKSWTMRLIRVFPRTFSTDARRYC